MSATHSDYLIDVARAAAAARHGAKGPIYRAACQHLGISLAELHRRLNAITVRPKRKQRADAGTSAMTYDEALLVSGYVMQHIRRNGKDIKSVTQAIQELRTDGVIAAGRVDAETGEFRPLSDSAILRALSAYKLHPSQLAQPDPVTPLSSPHPNWCWQIDASLCVIFKLPTQGKRIEEIRGQDAYKNKLQHFAKIEHLLVQRYLITDHYSGALRAHFALGGESAEGLISALIGAIVERPGYPLYGAPNLLMLDQAGANRSAMVRNLCHSLDIRLSYTLPGNPRSKGQVEGAHNLFECGFESGLKLVPEITGIEQLQELADTWVHWFNGTQVHSRHGLTRYEKWQEVTAGQLRRVDLDAKALRLLARTDPATPKVSPYLSVKFAGAEYDVSGVPDVLVGQKLQICRSGYDAEGAMVIRVGADGREEFFAVPKWLRDAGGFRAGAARIGEEFKRHKDTPAQTAKKLIELHATGAKTLDEARKARKANATPYGGAIDPHKAAKEYVAPAWLPKRGTPLAVVAPAVELRPWPVPRACLWLRERMTDDWTAEHYATVSDRYPGGVPEADLEGLLGEFRAAKAPAPRPVLKAV
jgi:transposase InsO family protein